LRSAIEKRVIVTATAEADVDRLWAFLAVRDPGAAVRAVDTIEAAIQTLGELSDRGRPAPVTGYRELPVPFGRGDYIIRYRTAPRAVLVTRIHHSNEDRGR
jgi:plasmid stabilization system protein ParE